MQNIKGMNYLLLIIMFLMPGCAMFSPPSPSIESHAVKAAWLGENIVDLKSVMGVPVSQQSLAGGAQSFRWHNEKTITGPPRHEFGPKGRIKTRPGTVDYYYCNAIVTADLNGRIDSLEFKGNCPSFMLPPSKK